jgi:DNA-directed RNA polymerase subunit beta'
MNTKETARELLGLDKVNQVEYVAISVASPEAIRAWSKGEVKNPETINYRTFKPEKGGLFCERIFGPVKDWECSCGKYKRIKHRGVVCDRCGVEVTLARVRRERMGHIELAVPVSHIWFFKCMPSRLGLVLDMTARNLERVIYYEDYMVIDPGSTPLKLHQLLSEHEYREARETYTAEAFVAKMGAEAVREGLGNVDLQKQIDHLATAMGETKSKQIRKKIAKRIKLLSAFHSSKTRPEWMILTVLPVIPPDLRPLVPLEGGRFATSDLNDLYRRVINRNNRLKNLLQLKTPEVIIRNEKRMLQEAVDALFDNGRHGRAVTGAGNRALKSLSDMLKGKSGRFRQNLLGKRVDYSGRSVIVIGPELKLHQCGLPKKMALVLFEPFIIRRLKELGYVHTVRSAKKMIERQSPEVWDILEEVTKGHPVLLNRAPTLHRLSIQAFEPILIEGEAIRIHPLVCTAYNADFDGDQMAVHVPLSVEAQLEARMLMMAPNNIFSPSSGRPIMTPTQDITLGCFYLTAEPRARKAARAAMLFGSKSEVIFALNDGGLTIHDRVRLANPDRGTKTNYGDGEHAAIETTVGRVIFSEIWPERLGFFNRVAGKSQLGEMIWTCYKICGHEETVLMLDKLKELGFRSATRSGCSIGIDDMIIPKEKEAEIHTAQKQIAEVEKQYRKGVITPGERYNKVIDIWTHCTDQIANVMLRTLETNHGKEEYNPVSLMVDSGARGNRQQVRQLAGVRGLMAKPSGDIIEKPILSNFREGLTVLEYFISTHGARKGLADTALKTADSGYMTRKLVDVAQDVIIRMEDCGTSNGIVVQAIYEGEDEVVKLSERIIGRLCCDEIIDPTDNKTVLMRPNELIDEVKARRIEASGVERVRIRSVLTCESKQGICAHCYGRNLATGGMIKRGEAVGIIAAQSIGEPGTQLTMRTFHIGGTASQVFKQPQIKAKFDGLVQFNDLRLVELEDGNNIVLNKNGSISIMAEDSGRELETHSLVIGSVIAVKNGGKVKKGEPFVQWDPYNVPILSEKAGRVRFVDIIEGVTMKQEVDETTAQEAMVVIEHKEDLHPQIVILTDKGEPIANYPIPSGAHIVVGEGDKIVAGTLMAKTPRKTSKTKDITGGLPRVAELFEARRPKDAAEISKIEGIVDFGASVRGKRTILIKDPQTSVEEEHLIPIGKHVIVFKGDFVKKGQQLTEGPVDPHEILDICGPQELQEHLVNEVQEVYRLQGVTINDKHIEIIVRQMLRKVRVTEPGDTQFLWGEQIDKIEFEKENSRVEKMGGKPAEAQPVLLGITKASLETESFLSAASFQDTTRVLASRKTSSWATSSLPARATPRTGTSPSSRWSNRCPSKNPKRPRPWNRPWPPEPSRNIDSQEWPAPSAGHFVCNHHRLALYAR